LSEEQTTVPDEPEPSDPLNRLVHGRGAIIAVSVLAVAVAVAAVWFLSRQDSSSSSTRGPVDASKPVALSADGLQTLAAAVPQPIYWAGARRGYLYELTRTTRNDVYIRYLPPGVDAGAKGANYLTVATYPFSDALSALQKVSNGKGIPIAGGGLALVDESYPNSVHLAYPDVDYQVEVYDPSPARAREVATSGVVQRVR
jgi:hypothetical protein